MSRASAQENSKKQNGFEPAYSMQIPRIDNADNFRMDKIIEEYKSKITTIAKFLIPERKGPQKLDPLSKNPDVLARINFKKDNVKNLLKINDAVMSKMTTSKSLDPKAHQAMITRMAKGDTKLMSGIPQLKSKDGQSLNSPMDPKKLEKYKQEAIKELKNLEESFDNKISEKDHNFNTKLNFLNGNQPHESTGILKKSNFAKNRDNAFFLTGVAGHEKKVDFNISPDNKDISETNSNNQKRFETKSNAGSSSKSLANALSSKKISTLSIHNIIQEIENKPNAEKISGSNLNNLAMLGIINEKGSFNSNFNNTNNTKKSNNISKNFWRTNNNIINDEEQSTDSDLFSEDNRYLSVRNGKKRLKSLQSLNSFKQVNNSQENFNFISNLNTMKNFDNLDRLKNKNDFFKMDLKTRSLKNLQNPATAKKEKKFVKTKYYNAINDFLSTVNTEVDQYQQTFTDIERGLKNYDFIQSVHYNIPPDKLKDKKMMYNDEKFVRKYFIYGTQGGQFISEDKENDDIIERSDNLAKITPEISYKFQKMIMNRFAEKPLVDFSSSLDHNPYKASKFKENAKKVAQLIDETDKRRLRVDNDLGHIFARLKEK